MRFIVGHVTLNQMNGCLVGLGFSNPIVNQNNEECPHVAGNLLNDFDLYTVTVRTEQYPSNKKGVILNRRIIYQNQTANGNADYRNCIFGDELTFSKKDRSILLAMSLRDDHVVQSPEQDLEEVVSRLLERENRKDCLDPQKKVQFVYKAFLDYLANK